MSIGNHSSTASATPTSSVNDSQPGVDRKNSTRNVSRSLPRRTAAPTSEAATKARATAVVATAKKAAAGETASKKAAADKAVAKRAARTTAAKKIRRTAASKRVNKPSALVAQRVQTRQARSAGFYGWTCAIASCGGNFTSPFGARWGREHLGDDFSVPVGTPLRSLNSATVVAAGVYGGMGNRVELDFGNGISAVYAHMSSISVSVGQKLSAGDGIGLSGNTGHSTGPHLHLEIHLNGTPVDPAPWLRAHGIF